MEEGQKTVLYLRDFPKDLARQVRAAAILSGKKMTDYIAEVLVEHLASLEQQGRLPGQQTGVWYSTLHQAAKKSEKPKRPKKG
jgi:hypothetical protein